MRYIIKEEFIGSSDWVDECLHNTYVYSEYNCDIKRNIFGLFPGLLAESS